MKPCLGPPPEDLYGPLLGHCAHLAREQMRARMSRYGMTPAQTHVLLYLAEHGPTVQSAVAEGMRVKAPTVNGIIDRMEEKGLLVRTVDEKDARRRRVHLTEKGEGFTSEFKRCFDEAEESIVRGFSPQERELLRTLLCRIIENLEEPILC